MGLPPERIREAAAQGSRRQEKRRALPLSRDRSALQIERAIAEERRRLRCCPAPTSLWMRVLGSAQRWRDATTNTPGLATTPPESLTRAISLGALTWSKTSRGEARWMGSPLGLEQRSVR